MKLNSWDKFIIVGLLFATSVNLFSDSLTQLFPNVQNLISYITAAVLVVWIVFIIARNVRELLTAGRFAAQALILNEKRELLLFNHPLHKKLLPPCGRVRLFEMPDEGLKILLQERIGLAPKDYRYHPFFHEIVDNQGVDFGSVIRVPAPFLVQKEKRKQRGSVKYHYDFFYVLELTNSNPQFIDNEYAPHIWVDFDKLNQLAEKDRTFLDVVDAYQRVLRKLSS